MTSARDFAILQAQARGVPGKRKRPPKVRTCPSEDEEQAMLFQWARLFESRYSELRLLWHLKSEGTTWSWRELRRAKALGVSPGIPDLFLPYAAHGMFGWFGEMKAKDGKLTDTQRDVLTYLNAAGFFAGVFYGWEQARDSLLWYLGEEK